MRKWIDLTEPLNEARDIPPTTYGYWITAEGEAITVSQDGAHYPIVRKHFGEDVSPKEYITAMEAGWIRIAGLYAVDGLHPEFCADTYGAATSRKAIRCLIEIASLYREATFLLCDETAGIDTRFANLSEFLRALRRATSTIAEDGRIVPGVNTTCDVQPGETARQARKQGNIVTPEGIPPTLRVDGKLA